MKGLDDKVILSVFVAVEGAHAFSAFMPSAFTIQKFATDGEDKAKLRKGYAPAIAFNLALAGSVSYLSQSPLPLLASLLVIAFMLAVYESSISAEAFGNA